MVCCTIYTGLPNRLRTDEGSIFTSTNWKQLTDVDGVHHLLAEATTRCSVETGERYNKTLKRMICKNQLSRAVFRPQYFLQNAVKAINNIMGESSSVPSHFAFGIVS